MFPVGLSGRNCSRHRSWGGVRAVYADALSQAVTGELIGMLNYSSMAHLYEDITDVEDAIEHADSERRHAAAFRRAARDLGVEIIEDVRAPYWGRVRDAFLGHVERGDRVACTVIQEIMLESFAVALYDAVAEVTEGKLGSTFGANQILGPCRVGGEPRRQRPNPLGMGEELLDG